MRTTRICFRFTAFCFTYFLNIFYTQPDNPSDVTIRNRNIQSTQNAFTELLQCSGSRKLVGDAGWNLLENPVGEGSLRVDDCQPAPFGRGNCSLLARMDFEKPPGLE